MLKWKFRGSSTLLFVSACCAQTVLGPSTEPHSLDVAVRLSEILISTPAPYDPAQVVEAQHRAEQLREAVRQGSDFADVARANSQGPTAAQGGDMGYFIHGKLSPKLEGVVARMRVGDVSEVLRTKQGFIIFKVTERVARGDSSLELLNQPMTGEMRAYVEVLKRKIQKSWYAHIPQAALAPERHQGSVTILFSVLRDGTVTALKVESGSGVSELDTAATSSIQQAGPFSPLPRTTTTDHLVLRIRFLYNPASGTP